MLYWLILGNIGAVALRSSGIPLGRSIFAGVIIALLGPLAMYLHPLMPLALWIVLGIVAGTILARKGYHPFLGVLAGLIGGPFGVLIAVAVPETDSGRQMAAQNEAIEKELEASRQTKQCPKCGRENSVTSRFCARCDYRYVEVA
jgi:hypothetical protein